MVQHSSMCEPSEGSYRVLSISVTFRINCLIYLVHNVRVRATLRSFRKRLNTWIGGAWPEIDFLAGFTRRSKRFTSAKKQSCFCRSLSYPFLYRSCIRKKGQLLIVNVHVIKSRIRVGPVTNKLACIQCTWKQMDDKYYIWRIGYQVL